MGRRALGVPAFLAVGLLAATAGRAAAEPRLHLELADTLAGDGAAATTARLVLEPAGAVGEVRVTADAGTVGPVRADVDGSMSFEYTAPRVIADRTVTLRATARAGKRTLTATARVRITAAIPVPGARRSGGAFDLTAPAHVLLEHDRAVEITLTAPAPPRLHASVGALDAPEAVGAGRWRATYRPPVETYPQVAIVAAASADGTRIDWLGLPLHARAEVELHSAPSTSVALDVDGVVYGPVQTDGRGRATLAVAVPPGVPAATTIAVDAFGNARRGRLSLDPPPLSRLLVICPQGEGDATALVVDARGAPTSDARLAMEADHGALAAPRRGGPGVHLARWGGAEAGETITIEAALSGEPSSRARCTMTVPSDDEHGALDDVAATDRRRWRWVASARGGYSSNLARVSGPLVAARAAVRPGLAGGRLELGLDAGVHLSRDTSLTAGGAEAVVTDVLALPLLARVQLSLADNRLSPYAAVAAGAVIGRIRVSTPAAPTEVTGGVWPAIALVIGGDTSLGPGRLLVEAGYLRARVETRIAAGNIGGLQLGAGYSVTFR